MFLQQQQLFRRFLIAAVKVISAVMILMASGNMLSFSDAVKVDRKAVDVRKEAAVELYENGTRNNILLLLLLLPN